MKKFTAVLRTLVLLFILVLAFWGTPFEVFGSGDSMVKVERIRKLAQATWIAIAWIAIEAAIAWFQALRKPKAPKGGAGAGPTADPPPTEKAAVEPPAAEPSEK